MRNNQTQSQIHKKTRENKSRGSSFQDYEIFNKKATARRRGYAIQQ